MKRIIALLLFSIIAQSALSAPAVTANDPSAARRNAKIISEAFAAMPPQTVDLPAGDIYTNTITTKPITACGRLVSHGSGGYSIDPTPQWGKITTRLILVGPGPLLRISGTGFQVDGPIEFVGDGSSDAIQVEGRTNPATGWHRFYNVIFRNWGAAFHALGGYYDGDQFVADENHADNTLVDGCQTAQVGTLFWSQNQQAVNWDFRKVSVNNLAGVPKTQLVADIERGGCVTFDGLSIEHPITTLFRVKDYSPNNCQLTVRGLYLDRVPYAGAGLKIIDYVGDPKAVGWCRWSLDIHGFSALQLPGYDFSGLYPANLPTDAWNVSIFNMPAASK